MREEKPGFEVRRLVSSERWRTLEGGGKPARELVVRVPILLLSYPSWRCGGRAIGVPQSLN